MAGTRSHSLRRRLLGSVMTVIALAALVQAISAYRGALQQADTMFDYHLQQMAYTLRGGPALATPLLDDGANGPMDYQIQIWSADGTHVFQSSQLALPAKSVMGFSEVTQKGVRYRVYSAQTPRLTIQIAQNMDERSARARALAAHAVLPMVAVAPLLMLILWWVISHFLAPLERTRRQVAARAAQDLSALPEDGLPSEVQPLVQEINLLFARLHDAFDAQRAFVANAAHELRSPLTALKLQAQALGRSTDPQTQQQAVVRLNQGVDRAIRLMQQLLVLARQESDDGAGAAMQSVDLQALTTTLASEMTPLAQARSIILDSSACEPALVDADTDSLPILLRNLLDNAIKYTPPNGRIEVRILTRAGVTSLSVEDSGPGIAADQRERVFERFFRTPDAGASGSGLGLSIARAIAQRHGARLVLGQSERLGGLLVRLEFGVQAQALRDR